jgi:hypothetical protein
MRTLALAAALFLVAVSAGCGSAPLGSVGGGWVGPISCTAPGECAAGGGYVYQKRTEGGDPDQAFVVNETKGSWGKPIEVQGIPPLNGGNSDVRSISCAAPGECAAGGWADIGPGYPRSRSQAFVVNERNGTWGKAIAVRGLPALHDSNVWALSCPAAGECVAGGSYDVGDERDGRTQAFVVSEKNGRWGKAIKVPGTSALGGNDTDVGRLSCAAAGECLASGYYDDRNAVSSDFVVTEMNGK